MKRVGLILVFVISSISAAKLDNNFLQTLEDAAEENAISESCRNTLQLYLENIQTSEDTWALRMLDATSKIPVGILSLNFGELGQFSQCLKTQSEDGSIQGKYCLGELSLDFLTRFTIGNEATALQKQAQLLRMASTNLITMESAARDDSVAAIPINSGISWAICLPSNCTDEDVGEILYTVLGSRSVNCKTKEDLSPSLSGGAIATITVLSFFAYLLVVSTALDLYYTYAQKKPYFAILVAFSVYTNGDKLFRISKNSNELTCLNGMRFFSMVWVLIGHVHLMYMIAPLVNFMDLMEWFGALRSMSIVSGTLSVDTFFFLAGLLLVYSFMKAMNHGIKFNIFKFYIHRYLRLTPALAAAVLFTAFLLRYVSTGPRWDSISSMEDGCRKYWWTTLLYVQNYANDGNYCLAHTWYLSIDMQLYIISPLILLPLWKYPKIGMGLIGAGIVTFIIVPFVVAYVNEIPALAMSDISSVAALTDYMKIYYIKTHTRAAPWFIGLLLGYVLAKIKFQGEFKVRKINKFILVALWAICLSVALTCIYGGHSTLRGTEFDVWANSFYIALVRPAWTFSLCWVVYACANGYGGPVNWFLSFPIYQVLNRFTYSVYLIHYPLMFVYALRFKTGVYFDELTMAYSFWGLTMFSFMISVVWVLTFESPVVILEKVIFSLLKKEKKTEANGLTNSPPA